MSAVNAIEVMLGFFAGLGILRALALAWRHAIVPGTKRLRVGIVVDEMTHEEAAAYVRERGLDRAS